MPIVQKHPDIAIIGGGVIGCAIAYYASKAGLGVTVADQGRIGGQASNVAAGLLAPSGQIKEQTPFSDLAVKSLELFPVLSEELREETGIDIRFNPCGTIRLALAEEEAKDLQNKHDLHLQLGFDERWLLPEEAHQLEPAATLESYGAMYSVHEGRVDAQKLTSAFVAAAKRYGAKFVEGIHIGDLTPHKDVFRSNHTIIAGGAWSSELGAQIGITIPVKPMKGQIANARGISTFPQYILFGSDIYIAPKQNNTITIGSTSEDVGYDQQPTISGLLELYTKALPIAPSLASATHSTLKAGMRPRTPDKLPIIGPIPGQINMSVATGHNSNGILFSAITGQIIVAQLTGKAPPINPAPFSIERFYNK